MMLVGMLPSEKLELAIYKHISALHTPASVTVNQLSQVTGELNIGRIVERLTVLNTDKQIFLTKYKGGSRLSLPEFGNDSGFFYTEPFLIEIAQGRKYFEELEQRAERMEEPTKSTRQDGVPEPGLQIFISHSSKDVALAEALTDLLKLALGLVPAQIRCTSVDGHRLPVGVNTESELRDEVNDAKVLIGLVTPSSLSSSFVMFELGARWGANLFLAPVLAGINPSGLGGPLKLLNALSANSEAQVCQLLDDVSKRLGSQLPSVSSYLRHVSAVKRLADSIPQSALDRGTPVGGLPELEIRQVGAVNYYFAGDKGPYCQPCYDEKGKRIFLTPPQEWNGGIRRKCEVCNKFFYEKPMTDSFGPIYVR
jgi:hypothetical protein